MKTITKISFIFLMLFLTGCMYTRQINPSSAKPYLDKTFRLSQSMILVQTRDPRPWGENYYYLVPAPRITATWRGRYGSVIHQQIPSVSDFAIAREKWQTWQGMAFFNESRIVGVLRIGTLFHVNKIITAYSSSEVEVTIDSGEYRGVKAVSVQPETLVGWSPQQVAG